MSIPPSGSDYERLKRELRRLKRRRAPWYFESALHQRLHGRRRRLRPISTGPVIMLAVITLMLLVLAIYVILIRSNLAVPGSRTSGGADSTAHLVRPGDSLSVR